MQRKTEEKLRLPTWLWLGLKIAGNGILGIYLVIAVKALKVQKKSGQGTKDSKVQKNFDVQMKSECTEEKS